MAKQEDQKNLTLGRDSPWESFREKSSKNEMMKEGFSFTRIRGHKGI